jgi:hypothetical protein
VVVGEGLTAENVTVGRSDAITLKSAFVRKKLAAASITNTTTPALAWTSARLMSSLPSG